LVEDLPAQEEPWFVVPADNRWFARMVVAGAVTDVVEKLNPQFPALGAISLPLPRLS
jgi:polyphosphate kinase 2 (PPK2 family)